MMMNMLNVVSIGGNALAQVNNISSLAESVYQLSKSGGVLMVHGNGTQIGELANVEHKNLGIITAQTEAEIGLQLEEHISEYISGNHGIKKRVEVVLTKVLIDPRDPAFRNRTKPIGRFYSRSEAFRLAKKGLTMKHLIKGYRRVVASPKPKAVLNLDSIKYFLNKGYIVIAGGGGGIPMFYKNNAPRFAEAVIDKDYTSALLAKSLNANGFFILTNVDGAYLNFGRRDQELIRSIGAKDLGHYLKLSHFESGSMGPKVEACIDFVGSTNRIAVIGNLKKAVQAIKLRGCTVVKP